jgi:F-type H+-transporting ATPase subunit a
MQRKTLIRLLPILLVLVSFVSCGEKATTTREERKQEVKEYVQHHLLDSHDFSLYSSTDDAGVVHHYGFPLPVILWDGGLQVFSSSKFHHGESVAEVNGNYYKLEHAKIYKTDAAGTMKYDDAHHATNVKPLDISITKGVFMMLLTALLMFLLFSSLAKSYAKNGNIATGAGRFFEPIILYIRDDIAKPNIGEKDYKRFMPYLLTVFFFIWFLNIFGLTPLGVNVTGNIAVTTALALIVFVITTFSGKKDYWKHIFDPLGDGMPWFGKIVIYIILVPIEILGMFIKPFALLIRLYANMTAGHVVLGSLIGLIYIFQTWMGGTLSFGLAFAISLIEVLVALLQAYIFTMLAALYFGFAVEEHDHGHDHETEVAH